MLSEAKQKINSQLCIVKFIRKSILLDSLIKINLTKRERYRNLISYLDVDRL